MGSWVVCLCGNKLHKNLFCGAGISHVVPEEWFEQDFEGMDGEGVVSKLVLISEKLIHCPQCARLVLVDDRRGDLVVRFYSPEEDPDSSEGT